LKKIEKNHKDYMLTTSLTFGNEQLNRIFPFHVLVDEHLTISSLGKSIEKIFPVAIGSRFFDSFDLQTPNLFEFTFSELKAVIGQPAVVQVKAAKNLSLSGQFEYFSEQNEILFLCTPSFFSNKESGKPETPKKENFLQYDSLLDDWHQKNTDKNHQKQLETQVKIYEKRYQNIFNNSQTFVCTHDLDGKLLTVNPATCKKLGYTNEELVGKNLSDFIPVKDLDAFQKEYLDVVKNTGSAKGLFKVISKSSREYILLYYNFKVEEENGNSYIMGFSQDVTERKKFEKEIRKTKQNTEDALKAKNSFLASMSHEIRTPLGGIIGITNLLAKTHLNEQQRKFANLISSSANSLLTIVNDVLDFEKISSGKFILEHIPFKLVDKVNSTIQTFQFKAEEKSVTLSFKSNVSDDLIVVGDPARLGQILNNLLSNSLKFTSSGGIYLSIYYYKNDHKTTTLEFEVSDTGIGIKPDKLNEIFNPYVQASSDTSRKYGGTGLGLSICKELIEMQGGKITVDSAVGVGTTFTFYIPYEKGDPSMLLKDNTDAVDYNSLKGTNILIAEDMELNQFLVENILQSWGCKITIVNNGREALEHVIENTYDIVLMDIHMPEMDGITATEHIRALDVPEKASVPIIALTANALKEHHLNYIDAGMNDCVTKPYTEEKLFQAIMNILKPGSKPTAEIVAALHTEDDDYIAQSSILYDLTLINSYAKGEPVLVKKMISVFLDSMNSELKKLDIAEKENDFPAISKVAHKMKAAIDTLGIDSLKQVVRDIETTNFTLPGAPDPQPLLETLKSTLAEAFIQLEGFLKL
jgi:PAS domain S-box-containing protein